MAIPPGYKRIDIVADTYRDESIKDPERSKRGCSEEIIVRSEKAKIPQNFTKFLQNGENKTRLIELIYYQHCWRKETQFSLTYVLKRFIFQLMVYVTT